MTSKQKSAAQSHPISPVYAPDSRILILGSFPSVKSREEGFFYGHPQNRFWKVLAALYDEDEALGNEARHDFLLRHHIALYDVIESCDVKGSSDASIRNVVPSYLRPILDTATIHAIYCNGGLAHRLYQQYQEKPLGMSATKLPSTSPANARYSLADLIAAWTVILES